MEPMRSQALKFCYRRLVGRRSTDTLTRSWRNVIGRVIGNSIPHYACSRAFVSSCGNIAPQSKLQPKSTCSYYHTRTFCASPQSRLCWSCQSVVSHADFFCPSCNSLQPPDERKDYFQVLDCETSFDLDIQELQKKYRNLQRFLHPDYFSQKSQIERDISEKHSSFVNKAYKTLLSPLERGIYLLSIQGITIKEGADSGMGPEFLNEILEISEHLNEVNTSREIEDVGHTMQDKCERLIEDISNAFQQGDLHGVKTLLTKMKYYSNILDQVKKKLIP
ncbi:iron-sulfur cluster co-chaperone protein HscB [Spea bombifrons]|uniref:iron-sulfur cluster co-chaperone protein HscB n=1 Tax=Spea bombifrons TaxID=233779 RepID=UPI00234B7421|nr:iron-sulfur cluster co-chaperone protein HscB [Spea bombifrons]